jgi:ABC-2 type transport system ATP-binding protein
MMRRGTKIRAMHRSGFASLRSRRRSKPACWEVHMELVIDGVSKLYRGRVWGLREFSLTLQPGVLALLGPNGAGKSTLMRILATISRPTEGMVTWRGAGDGKPVDIARSPDAVRTALGYLPQDFGVYPNLNAVEFLGYVAALKGLGGRAARNRIEELLQVLNLFDARQRPLGSFSGGMKQRVGIAQALLNDPQLLIVDEPTAGLDPEERVRFRNLLSDLAGERIVILSTHIVSDAEAAATQIGVINRGHLLTCGAPETLLGHVASKVWQWTVPSVQLEAVRQQHLVSNAARRADGVHVRVVADTRPGEGAVPVVPTLEDAYLHLLAKANGRDGGAAS